MAATAERASLMGGPDNSSLSPKRDAFLKLNRFVVKFVAYWMIGAAVLAILQLTSDYYIPFYWWLVIDAAAAGLITMASSTQLGIIWSNSKTHDIPTSVRLYYFSGLIQSIFITALLAVGVFLFTYTSGNTAQVDRLYETTPRSWVQERLYMFLSLHVVAGAYSLLLLLSGLIFATVDTMRALVV